MTVLFYRFYVGLDLDEHLALDANARYGADLPEHLQEYQKNHPELEMDRNDILTLEDGVSSPQDIPSAFAVV